MTVIEAALEVLRSANRPLTASEIFAEIQTRKLYAFAAKDPLNVLRAQLRRHCEGYDRKVAAARRCIRRVGNDAFEALAG
jgi:restriction system protein